MLRILMNNQATKDSFVPETTGDIQPTSPEHILQLILLFESDV